MIARVLGALAVALTSCAHRPAMCTRVCDAGFACVSGECLRAGAIPAVEGLDKFGLYQTRRLVIAPVEIARLGPGDVHGEIPRVATLARERDEAAVLLLRFALDLPPGTTIVEAHIVLDRALSVDTDPAPIVLHAARISEHWDARSISWARAPRMDDARLPATTIDDARPAVRIDVRNLVRRWRLHAPDDQGIAIVADRSTRTGMAFAVADGSGSSDDAAQISPVRTPAPPALFAASEGGEGQGEAPRPRGPRLELYVKP